MQDVKEAFPGVQITVFCGSSNYEISCLIPHVDTVIKLPIRNPFAAIARIRREGPFDLWIDLGPWPRLNALFSSCARAALTVGFSTPGQYRHYGYDVAVRHLSTRHEVDNYRALLRSVGVESGRNPPRLTLGPGDGRREGIVVHMFPGGSRSHLKVWPEERWCELIGLLTKDGFSVSLTGTEADRPRALSVRDRAPGRERVAVAAGNLGLAETAKMLDRAQLVISVDTGIMHIASALGCNLVALHGPTLPERWGPLNGNAVAVTARDACSPCLSLGFESRCTRADCMLHISVNDVYQAVRKLLRN
jgi:heptosyltransferase I